jgi:predicted secreted hydrolase
MGRFRTLICLFLPLAVTMDAVAQGDNVEGEAPARLAELLGSEAGNGFARALEPRPFEFPADHGPHPEFRNEWWYFTGNLEGENGRRFGFELTFFRFALSPDAPVSDSGWRTNQVYMAHFALTDAGNDRFFVSQRFARGAVGLAGAQVEPFRVWLEDWRVGADTDGRAWRMVAQDQEFAVELVLVSLREPVANGVEGLSLKSSEPGNASYYYSITRLQTDGRVRIGERNFEVSGLSWLDREWSTSALAANQAGWDWFALQLSDGSDLMFYSLRGKDGRRDEASAGTWVSAAGEVARLENPEVEITVLDTWSSPEGGTYPARWRLEIPRIGLDVTVTPLIANQELSNMVRYWEGAVDVEGIVKERAIGGRGYVELTGYAD